MRRMWKTLMTLAVAGSVATGAAVATTVAAQSPEGQTAPKQRMRGPGPDGGGPGRFGGPMFERSPFGIALPLRELDLNEAQQEQVRTILQGHREEIDATLAKVRAAAKAQHDAVIAVPYDEGQIRERAAALAAVESDAAVLRARVHSEVFAVLTAEQQAKANQLRAEREQRLTGVRQRLRERVQQRQPKPQAQ